jgi:hypothetical protein
LDLNIDLDLDEVVDLEKLDVASQVTFTLADGLTLL